jgi:aminopeptidase N
VFLFSIIVLLACNGVNNNVSILPESTQSPTLVIDLEIQNPRPGSTGIGDPFFPGYGNGGYDILHYTLELAVDMEENIISGTVTIEAVALHDLSSFNLDFIGFTIDEITVDGVAAEFHRNQPELIVSLPFPIATDTSFTTMVNYSGTPEGISSTISKYLEGWNYYGDYNGYGVMVAGEPVSSQSWYPVNDHPLDKATYSFIITVKSPFVVAANGLLKETIDSGENITYIWESENPIASYLVTLGIGDFEIEEEEGPNGLPIRNYFDSDISERVRNNFDRTAEMIGYFSSIFGPYPFESYGVIVHDINTGFALETQTLSVFGNSFINENVVAHELAHQWFGDSVSLSSWKDIWLNEGFATYATTLWFEHTRGIEYTQEDIRMLYAAMAPMGEIYYISKSDLYTFLSEEIKPGIHLSKKQAAEALESVFSDFMKEDELLGDIDGTDEDGISGEEFSEIVNSIDFEYLPLNDSQLNRLFEALEMPAYVINETFTIRPPGDPSPDKLFSSSVYYRGALTLHALRLNVGDDIFFKILQTYFLRFHNSNATTESFIAIAEEISGVELDDFFYAWLYQQEIPDIPEMGLYREDFLIDD